LTVLSAGRIFQQKKRAAHTVDGATKEISRIGKAHAKQFTFLIAAERLFSLAVGTRSEVEFLPEQSHIISAQDFSPLIAAQTG